MKDSGNTAKKGFNPYDLGAVAKASQNLRGSIQQVGKGDPYSASRTPLTLNGTQGKKS